MIQHDVLIVGSGIAGMRCALEIKRQQPTADVALVTKLYPTRAPSVIEREGIAAALGNVRFDETGALVPSRGDRTFDSPAQHAADTLKYAEGLADPAAVQLLCEQAPKAVYELEHMGTPFSRTAEGRIAQRAGWGHTQPRVAYAADRTGHAITHTLYGELIRFGIKVYPEWYVLSLAHSANRAQGVVALDIRSGETVAFQAKATVLATGSYGRIFGRTNDTQSSTGDGLALAYRAGLPLQDVELVQFHPLGLYSTGFVISERILLDGAHLLNGKRERVLKRYAKELELAPLAVISAAIEHAIAAGDGAGEHKDHVWLDVRHLPANHLREHYPHLLEYAADYLGINPLEQLVPVLPTAAATLGGIPTNLDGAVLDAQQQPVAGLYAVGACASNGVNGANLLPGNALLSAVVFGRRTGAAIAAQLKAAPAHGDFPADALQQALAEVEALLHQQGDMRAGAVRERLLATMSAACGPLRQSELLTQHLGSLHELRAEFNRIALDDKGHVYNAELVEALELSRMLDWGEAIIAGALAREESRGVHSRSEYAAPSTAQHTLTTRQTDGTPQVSHVAAPDMPAVQA